MPRKSKIQKIALEICAKADAAAKITIANLDRDVTIATANCECAMCLCLLKLFDGPEKFKISKIDKTLLLCPACASAEANDLKINKDVAIEERMAIMHPRKILK